MNPWNGAKPFILPGCEEAMGGGHSLRRRSAVHDIQSGL